MKIELKALGYKSNRLDTTSNNYNRNYGGGSAGSYGSYSRGGSSNYNPTIGKGGSVKFYTYYGKQRHAFDACYKKHDFSPGFKTKIPNLVANNVIIESSTSVNSSKAKDIVVMSFTHDQYQKLLSLIQDQSITTTTTPVHSINQVMTTLSSISNSTQINPSTCTHTINSVKSQIYGYWTWEQLIISTSLWQHSLFLNILDLCLSKCLMILKLLLLFYGQFIFHLSCIW